MSTKGLQVVVQFPSEILLEHQGPALLLLERTLREATKLDVRVVKNLMEDDSMLRRFMTAKQREKL